MGLRLIAVVAGLSLLLAACSPPSDRPMESVGLIDGTDVTATVHDIGEGLFRVEYSFATPQSAMIFSRSRNDYRSESWHPLDPGVRLERLNGFDALIFETPTLGASFNVRARPEIRYLEYSHFVSFSDGGLALFTGQFELLPVVAREAALALNGDLSRWNGEQPLLGVRVQSDRPMIRRGERIRSGDVEISTGGGAFIYFGDSQLEASESYVGIMDQELPAWIRETFPDTLAFLFSQLEQGWGFALEQPAALLFAYEGNENPGFSNKGGVLDRQLIMQSSGQQLDQDDDYVRPYLMWFFAHEASHLFQFSRGPQLSDNRDSWIHEGAANAMANRILFEQTPENHAYWRYATARAWSGCIASLENGPLRGAALRGEFQAYYDCGEFMALMTDAMLPELTLYDFWNEMLTDAEMSDNAYNATTYFSTLSRLGVEDDLIARLSAIVDNPTEDPGSVLLQLMIDVGLEPEFTEANNAVRAYRYPQ